MMPLSALERRAYRASQVPYGRRLRPSTVAPHQYHSPGTTPLQAHHASAVARKGGEVERARPPAPTDDDGQWRRRILDHPSGRPFVWNARPEGLPEDGMRHGQTCRAGCSTGIDNRVTACLRHGPKSAGLPMSARPRNAVRELISLGSAAAPAKEHFHELLKPRDLI